MKRLFGFSTGTIWNWSKQLNRAGLTDHLYDLDIDGVELTFGFIPGIYAFSLAPEQVAWLRSLKYVSLHAPPRPKSEKYEESEAVKQLEHLQMIYKKVKARNIVIHAGVLPPKKILDRFDMHFSVENLSKDVGVSFEKLAQILKAYPDISLCLDVAHAYSWSEEETKRIVEKFRDKITEVHVSGHCNGKDHASLQRLSKSFIKSLKPVLTLKVPIILEETIMEKNINLVKKEISCMKSLFSNEKY